MSINELPIRTYYTIGESENEVSRRGVSYTPSSDMTLRHFSFVATRQVSSVFDENSPTALAALTDAETITWEIRTGVSGNKPGTSAASLLDTGTFDWRYSSSWKVGRPIRFTVNLTEGLQLAASTQYWFILILASGARYVLNWATTYKTGAAGEVSAAVYCSQYVSSWSTGDNTYNLTLYILDDQAGEDWHVVIDGKGYMQPDKMRGYRCEQASSGLAASRGGQEDYSQLRYPYSNLSQSSWTSGSGQLVMDDPAAFLYAKNLDTSVPQQAFIGPRVTLTGLNTNAPSYEPTVNTMYDYLIELASMTSPIRYIAQKFTAPTGGISATSIGINAYKSQYYIDAELSVGLYSDNAGTPDSLIGAWVKVSPTNIPEWLDVAITPEALTAGAKYWVVVKTSQTNLNLGEFRVLITNLSPTYSGGSYKRSTDGTTWSTFASTISVAFRINGLDAGRFEDTVRGIKYGAIGTTGTLAAIGGRGVYTWSETNGYWNDISAGIVGTGSSYLPVNASDLIFFNGKLLVAQGLNNPIRVWDGVSWGAGSAPTLVSNGEFTSNTTSWSAGNATIASVTGGQSGNCLEVTNSSAATGYATQTVTVVSGKWYEISVWGKKGTGSVGQVKVGTTLGASDYVNITNACATSSWVHKTALFKATGTSAFVVLSVADAVSGHTVFFDTVSVQEAPAAKYFHIGRGFLWASTGVNKVRRTNDLTSWSAEITIGEDLYDITAMTNYQGRLLVGKEDGIWEVDQQDLATEYLIFREHADPDNCIGWSVWSGMLFIPVQNSIWRWQGSQYKDIGPTDKRSGPTKEWPNKVSRMTSSAPLLFASVSPVVSTGYSGLLAYNGLGWHHLASSNTPNTVAYAVCVTSEIGTNEVRIWWGDGPRINYVKYPVFTNNRYDWTSANFCLNGGVLVTSWWDGGLKDALKFWNRVTLIADIPDLCSISVYAAKDGQEWLTTADMAYLGTLYSSNMSDNGEYVLMFPDGMVAKSIQLVFMLNTHSASATPRIKACNVESLVRQQPAYSYSFRILLADNVTKMDGSTESTRTANTMWEELQRVAARNAPVTISFPYKSIRGVVSYLREETSSFKPDGMEEETWERVASVSVVEAT